MKIVCRHIGGEKVKLERRFLRLICAEHQRNSRKCREYLFTVVMGLQLSPIFLVVIIKCKSDCQLYFGRYVNKQHFYKLLSFALMVWETDWGRGVQFDFVLYPSSVNRFKTLFSRRAIEILLHDLNQHHHLVLLNHR